jgi:hypothetical protein
MAGARVAENYYLNEMRTVDNTHAEERPTTNGGTKFD